MIGASHRLRHWPLHATLAPETSTLVLLDLANPPKLRHGLGCVVKAKTSLFSPPPASTRGEGGITSRGREARCATCGYLPDSQQISTAGKNREQAMTESVQIEDRGAVRIVAINRPEARNAINTGVLIGLRKVIREAAKDEALRSLVVTGRGGAFSAGADVKE